MLVAATGRSLQNIVHNTHALLVRQNANNAEWVVIWKSSDQVAWDVLDENSNVPTRLLVRLMLH